MDAWRDGYIYGKRDGEEGKSYAPRGDAEGYKAGYQWGQRHPRSAFRMPPTYPPGEMHGTYDVSGAIGADGLVYSDADPGL